MLESSEIKNTFKGKVVRSFIDLDMTFEKGEILTFKEAVYDSDFYYFGRYRVPKTHVEKVEEKKEFRIAVDYAMAGTITIEAFTFEDAMKLAKGYGELPKDGFYIDDSWEVNEDMSRQFLEEDNNKEVSNDTKIEDYISKIKTDFNPNKRLTGTEELQDCITRGFSKVQLTLVKSGKVTYGLVGNNRLNALLELYDNDLQNLPARVFLSKDRIGIEINLDEVSNEPNNKD